MQSGKNYEVDSMLKMGEMRPSTLPYTSPMVKKKDDSKRVCVDFRKLKITKADPQPMMMAEDLFL